MTAIRRRVGLTGVLLACLMPLIWLAANWEDRAENSRMKMVATVLQAHPEVHRRFGSSVEIHSLDQGKQPVSGISYPGKDPSHRTRFEVTDPSGSTQTIWVSWSHSVDSDLVEVHHFSDAPYGPVFWVGENNGNELKQGWNALSGGDGRVMITYKHDYYSPESPSLEGLGVLVRSTQDQPPQSEITSINLSEYFRDDWQLQIEFREALKREHPEVFEDAMSVTGNARNPKVRRLSPVFESTLRKTPTIREIDRLLEENGLVIVKITFSELCVYDHDEGRRLFAVLWLATNNSDAEQEAGAGQPATRPESKTEGSEKPQLESEGRSR